jgi:predicted transcriptional regulator
MAPPRVKPCPACAAPCPVQSSLCLACGHLSPRRKGGRPAPSWEARDAAAFARKVHLYNGKPRDLAPELIGRRNLSNKGAKVLAEIRRLAADGLNATQIAHIIGQTNSSVRRYAKDYGVVIVKGEPGPAMNGKLYAQTVERVEACHLIMQRTVVVAEVAEALGIGKAATREYMKRCRDLYEIDLPEFDRRKASGFAVIRRQPGS